MTDPVKPAPDAAPKKKQDKVLIALAALLAGLLIITTALQISNGNRAREKAAAEAAAKAQAVTTETTDATASASAPAADAVSTATAKFPVAQAMGKAIGNPDAPVKIIEFASLTCGHCAHFHNDTFEKFREKYIDSGKVFMEFREFPLNKPAFDATLLANCLPADQYFGFITMLFQTQDHWAFASDYLTPLKQNAKLAGMSEEGIEACLADPAAREKLTQQVEANVKKYNLQSTPTFVINEGAQTIMGAQPLEGFSSVIDPLLTPAADIPAAATEPATTPDATTTPAPEGTPAP